MADSRDCQMTCNRIINYKRCKIQAIFYTEMINLTEWGKIRQIFTPFCQYEIVAVGAWCPSVITELAFRTLVLPQRYVTKTLE